MEPTSVDESPANPNGTDCEEHHHPTEDLVPEYENTFYDNIGNAEDVCFKFKYSKLIWSFCLGQIHIQSNPAEL